MVRPCAKHQVARTTQPEFRGFRWMRKQVGRHGTLSESERCGISCAGFADVQRRPKSWITLRSLNASNAINISNTLRKVSESYRE